MNPAQSPTLYIQWKGYNCTREGVSVFNSPFHVVEIDGNVLVVIASHQSMDVARKTQKKNPGTGIIHAWFEEAVFPGGVFLHDFDWKDDPRVVIHEDDLDDFLESL